MSGGLPWDGCPPGWCPRNWATLGLPQTHPSVRRSKVCNPPDFTRVGPWSGPRAGRRWHSPSPSRGRTSIGRAPLSAAGLGAYPVHAAQPWHPIPMGTETRGSGSPWPPPSQSPGFGERAVLGGGTLRIGGVPGAGATRHTGWRMTQMGKSMGTGRRVVATQGPRGSGCWSLSQASPLKITSTQETGSENSGF